MAITIEQAQVILAKRGAPEPPGERSWIGRFNTPEKFVERGQEVADHFRSLFADHGEAYMRESIGADAPGLMDAVLAAFPAKEP